MKVLTIILAVILVVLLGAGALVHFGTDLTYSVSSSTLSASEDETAFRTVCAIIEVGAAAEVFSDAIEPTHVEDYAMMDIHIGLKNPGLLTAEWVSVRLEPAEGDVAVYSLNLPPTDIVAHGSGVTNLKLLTRTPDAPRALHVEYYIFGMKHTLSVPC